MCVSSWGSEENIYIYKWIRTHLLQGKDHPAGTDRLYIVHVNHKPAGFNVIKAKEKERWDAGGAVVPDVRTAVAGFNASIHELEGDPGPEIIDFVNREHIDIVVLGSRGRNLVHKAITGSVSQHVLTRATCACLLGRTQVGVGDSYRMRSVAQPSNQAMLLQQGQLQQMSGSSPTSPTPFSRLGSLSGALQLSRRVAVAYDTTAHGRYLLTWAGEHVLSSLDNVFVVRVVPKALLPGRSTLTLADTEATKQLAADALASFRNVTAYQLEGPPRAQLEGFVSKEGVDLLIIGAYKDKTRRKGLTSKGAASAIWTNVGCPALVVHLSTPALQEAVEESELAKSQTEEAELGALADEESDDEASDSDGEPTGDARHKSGRPPLTIDVSRAVAGSSAPAAGTYVIQIDKHGRVKSMQPHDADVSAATPAATSSSKDSGAATPSGAHSHLLEGHGGLRNQLSRAGSGAASPLGTRGSLPGALDTTVGTVVVSGPPSDVVDHLRRQMEAKDAEILELRAQLQQLQLQQGLEHTAARQPFGGPDAQSF